MKPKVNQDLCIGCGLCCSLCPEVFELDENGIATCISECDDSNTSIASDAANSCPVMAIEMEE